jgi:hypothetical protein
MTVLPEYVVHTADTDSFQKAIQHLYESILITKAVVVCVNEADVLECVAQLNDLQFSASALVPSMFSTQSELRALYVFKKSPNHILVISHDIFDYLDERAFNHYFMETPWNALLGNNVPSYHMDAICAKIHEAHKEGYWGEDNPDYFHLMFYLN